MRNRLAYAGFGVLSTLVGVGVGHLVAALTDPATSPVLAVGSAVIDLTPTPLKEWAIAHFGTHDKTILVGSVLLGVLALAAIAGLLARRRFAYGAGLLVALVAVAALATLTRPSVSAVDLVPSLAAAVVGVASLAWLVRAAGGEAFGHAAQPVTVGRQASGPQAPGRAPTEGASRRGVLVAAGALAAVAAVAGGAGRLVATARARIGDIALPPPADPAGAFPQGLERTVPGITPFRTPVGEFYRVDTRLSLPVIDQDSWRLTIDGDVDREVGFGFDDILAMDLIERDITLTCVSNDVGGPYIGGARWLGVPLKDLLDQAGIAHTSADQILSTDVDGMTISTPLRVALDGRDSMLAVGMNGGPLPREHGFPARMVVPGLYGFVSATKWVTRMTLTTYAEQTAYWTDRKWAIDAPIKVSSRIDTPRGLHQLKAGRTFIGGIAWAQGDGIAKVEVRIDGGPWQEARLGPAAGVDYWRQWYLPWDARPGSHMVACRATTRGGTVQTAARATPFPDGSSGIQQIVIPVA